MIRIEVVYRQTLLKLSVVQGCILAEAIARSGILQQFPEIDLAQQSVGICNKVMPLDTIVQEGERVEIYQPLLIDPKDARRQRVVKKKGPQKSI